MSAPMLLLGEIYSDGHMSWSGGWWILMALGMILFWGLVIFMIAWVVRELRSRADHPDHSRRADDPMAILDRRLAEGAVSAGEYRQRKSILAGEPAAPPSSGE